MINTSPQANGTILNHKLGFQSVKPRRIQPCDEDISNLVNGGDEINTKLLSYSFPIIYVLSSSMND